MGMERGQFAELYEALYARVLACALHRVPPDEAREAVDEAFLIAWRKRAQLTPEAMLPWMLVTVRNVIANSRRRGRTADAVTAEIERLSLGYADCAAEAHVIERLTVLEAFSELTEGEREVLILTVWDGLDNREAARVIGCTYTAFAVRLHRARRRLADALERIDTQLAPDRTIKPHHVFAGEGKDCK